MSDQQRKQKQEEEGVKCRDMPVSVTSCLRPTACHLFTSHLKIYVCQMSDFSSCSADESSGDVSDILL